MGNNDLSKARQNSPSLWIEKIQWPSSHSNKYTRGHVLIVGGPVMIGAARLAAMAARRAGAGLVSIGAPQDAFNIYATTTEPGIIIAPFKDMDGFKKIILDKHVNTIVIGPGAGADISGASTEGLVLAAINSGLNVVVDADGINAFKENPEKLFKAIKASPAAVVITPHGGEFARLFPQLTQNYKTPEEKLKTAIEAANLSGAIVVFKGADTVIASPDILSNGPDGLVPEHFGVIDSSGPAWLATAGSGDVLAGIIGAMISQGGSDKASTMYGACAAQWMQARSAAIFGPGLVAEDIIQNLPAVWAELFKLTD